MIDAFAILSTSLVILYVVVRAIHLDKSAPWFETIEPNDDPVDRHDKPVWQSDNEFKPTRY